tara:strand:- start:493 stop:732 length:240 start_codon:yes stop_codon:yes gene_type:complete
MLRQITKAFLMNESFKATAAVSVQGLHDILTSLRPSNKRDRNRIQMAQEHLRHLKREMRQLNEKIDDLENQLQVLNEEK